MSVTSEPISDIDGLPWWRHKSLWILLLLGFSSGIPLYLIFSSLSLWLREAGVERSAVTFFSWAALGYSFKFIWAPLVDKLPLPVLSGMLGRRRAWLLLSQIAVISSIVWMAMSDPQQSLLVMALAAVALGFAAATQDIVIDALRIELDSRRIQALLSSTYVAGYRVGMIVSGAGALYLAQGFGSTTEFYSYEAWRNTYLCMALLMLVGVVTTLLINESDSSSESDAYPYATQDYVRFLLVFVVSISAFVAVFSYLPEAPVLFSGYAQLVFSFCFTALALGLALLSMFLVARTSLRLGLANRQLVDESYIQPLADFLHRYGRLAIWVLLLVGFYRVSDIVLGVIANVFYQDMGYSKAEIASVSKTFGVVMTITGAFLGGFLVLKYGVMRILMLGGVLVALTNLLFMVLANSDADIVLLAAVIAADNMSGGIATATFIAWLSSLTNVSFTATQYAIFSSLMTLFPKLLGGYSGTIVEAIGYSSFFLIASLLGVPVVWLIYFLSKSLELEDPASG
ncbi:MAG: MFS transporter [Proteobacteria bacterium]|nr:MFS transporter [Pseudomonadota bacterium]